MKAPKQIEQLSLSEELEEVITSRESSSESVIVTTSCLALLESERVERALLSTLLRFNAEDELLLLLLGGVALLGISLTSSDMKLAGDTVDQRRLLGNFVL